MVNKNEYNASILFFSVLNKDIWRYSTGLTKQVAGMLIAALKRYKMEELAEKVDFYQTKQIPKTTYFGPARSYKDKIVVYETMDQGINCLCIALYDDNHRPHGEILRIYYGKDGVEGATMDSSLSKTLRSKKISQQPSTSQHNTFVMIIEEAQKLE